jgi:hypothetical protein
MNLRLQFFALLLLLTACNRNSDARLQGKLPGTWTTSHDYIGFTDTSTVTVGPTGAYDMQVTEVSSNGTTRIFTLSGICDVRNGLLIDTITKHSQTDVPLPVISTSSIVRLDTHELVIKYLPGQNAMTNEIIFRKVEKLFGKPRKG